MTRFLLAVLHANSKLVVLVFSMTLLDRPEAIAADIAEAYEAKIYESTDGRSLPYSRRQSDAVPRP